MPIMSHILYRDMINFFRNQHTNIILLVFLSTLISVFIGYILSPNVEQLIKISKAIYVNKENNINLKKLIHDMSIEQQYILLKIFIANCLSSLIGNVLLTGWILTMINLISNYKSINIIYIIISSIKFLPRLIILIFLMTLIIELGLVFIIIPGIIFAVIFSLSSIIIVNNNLGVIKSMHISANLAFSHFRSLIPVISFWLVSKIIILLLVTKFIKNSLFISSILINSFNNLFLALLLIYLYRFYMLLKQK